MIKSFTALTLFALLGALVIALPGFSPQVKADEAIAFTKADRLVPGGVLGACSSQVWPDFDASCMRSGSGVMVREVRLVTTRR